MRMSEWNFYFGFNMRYYAIDLFINFFKYYYSPLSLSQLNNLLVGEEMGKMTDLEGDNTD